MVAGQRFGCRRVCTLRLPAVVGRGFGGSGDARTALLALSNLPAATSLTERRNAASAPNSPADRWRLRRWGAQQLSRLDTLLRDGMLTPAEYDAAESWIRDFHAAPGSKTTTAAWTCMFARWTIPPAMAAPDPIPDLLKAVNEASGKAFALWITFLTVGTYLAITIGTTTHLQLLLAGPVKLPLLGVDMPLFAFYRFAPPMFVVLHLYVLMQLYLLARLLRLFDDDLRAVDMIEQDRRRVRGQLDKFVFTQFLIGAPQDANRPAVPSGSGVAELCGRAHHFAARISTAVSALPQCPGHIRASGDAAARYRIACADLAADFQRLSVAS